jgi:hypothetical protein
MNDTDDIKSFKFPKNNDQTEEELNSLKKYFGDAEDEDDYMEKFSPPTISNNKQTIIKIIFSSIIITVVYAFSKYFSNVFDLTPNVNANTAISFASFGVLILIILTIGFYLS